MSYTMTEQELKDLFEPHGAVASVAVIMDRETGRPRGFGFVEFEDSTGADAAKAALDGQEIGGRTLRVDMANERERR